ncbi:hypothetical protein N7537_004173 [Penicillium hordei]|uniref:Uncharacterized protein n=1 Tax=Penicillium hordei TaxID=40994 RepID=A0AAD6EAZ9_9EURO|nr:uncharacterized protein N7537_004173 [Penicillium hordei]KAJ5607554.1 hypothetical protein N7537_004173 [Penicillium hordei]
MACGISSQLLPRLTAGFFHQDCISCGFQNLTRKGRESRLVDSWDTSTPATPGPNMNRSSNVWFATCWVPLTNAFRLTNNFLRFAFHFADSPIS